MIKEKIRMLYKWSDCGLILVVAGSLPAGNEKIDVKLHEKISSLFLSLDSKQELPGYNSLSFTDLVNSVRNVLLHCTKICLRRNVLIIWTVPSSTWREYHVKLQLEISRLSLYFTEDRYIKNLRNVSNIFLLHEQNQYG